VEWSRRWSGVIYSGDINWGFCFFFLQVLLQEAHEEALQVALDVFNTEAVGGGNARKKYEQQLYSIVKKKFEVQL
jgi:hypothetical protein